MKEIVLPVGLVAIIGCMLLPLPSFAVDCLLVVNLIFSVLLVASSLYLSNPLKLSSLPTILLLATLYRLALNISTTRRILGNGDAGEMIEMFGSLLMQGEIFVGLVVFLVITLVQFIVIAKGSERVAEVSARFTLDALPGKQMSIDADIRSGLIDVETARKKREALQIESRFYGALDGAMKFVKGDAIAGIVITAVNILGGLAVGLLVKGLPIGVALQKYTILTLGDGLLSQIPALLNALAAGLIVTRVAKEDGTSLAFEVLDQLGSIKPALVLSGAVSLLLALVGVAPIPFLAFSSLLLFLGLFSRKSSGSEALLESEEFKPLLPPLITIELPETSHLRQAKPLLVKKELSAALQHLYDEAGLLLTPPNLSLKPSLEGDFRFSLRGVCESSPRRWSEQSSDSGESALKQLTKEFIEFVLSRRSELIDDIFTRRVLDRLEEQCPELVTNAVPGVLSVTQLSFLLRNLVREGITIRNVDVILQAASEQEGNASNERYLLEEVRIALSRAISAKYAKGGIIRGFRIDPVLDMWIIECDREQSSLNPEILLQIEREIERQMLPEMEQVVVLTSRGARRLLQDCLRVRGLTSVTVLAEEELSNDVSWIEEGCIRLSEEKADECFGALAA